jgi:hypothetical protein
MLEKKFSHFLLLPAVLLVFSAASAMGANILFVSSMDAEHMPGDDTIKAFFESLGHTVTYIDDDQSESATEDAALAADLVYISESVGSGDIKNEITEVPTPIIVAEPYAWDEMGLITGGGTNQVPDSANITIVYPGHPMAAGYSGDVSVYTDLPGSELIPAGTTGGDAIVIARASGGTQADADVYFLYEKGATLAVPAADGSGQIAAGIRIGFFATSPTAEQLLTQQGYDLLEAAVNYALGLTREADLASAPSPGNSAENVPLAPVFTWTPGERAESHDVYLGTDFDSVSDANRDSANVFKGTVDVNSYSPLPLDGATTYYWRIDEVGEGAAGSPWKGHVWTFTTIPLIASNPSPADGQDASIPLELTWTPGGKALQHKVYFGTDPDALVYYSTKPADEPAYTIRGLEVGKTYYWRVDEINNDTTYSGDVCLRRLLYRNHFLCFRQQRFLDFGRSYLLFHSPRRNVRNLGEGKQRGRRFVLGQHSRRPVRRSRRSERLDQVERHKPDVGRLALGPSSQRRCSRQRGRQRYLDSRLAHHALAAS